MFFFFLKMYVSKEENLLKTAWVNMYNYYASFETYEEESIRSKDFRRGTGADPLFICVFDTRPLTIQSVT